MNTDGRRNENDRIFRLVAFFSISTIQISTIANQEEKGMKKNNVQKIRRIKVVTKIEKKQDRPLFPRPVVFSDKKTYDRNREKRRMRDEYGF